MSKALDIEGLDTIEAVLPDFSLSPQARNRSPRTIQSYCEAAKLLDTLWVPRRSSVAATRTFGATAPRARMRLWRSRSSTWPSSA